MSCFQPQARPNLRDFCPKVWLKHRLKTHELQPRLLHPYPRVRRGDSLFSWGPNRFLKVCVEKLAVARRRRIWHSVERSSMHGAAPDTAPFAAENEAVFPAPSKGVAERLLATHLTYVKSNS